VLVLLPAGVSIGIVFINKQTTIQSPGSETEFNR